MNSNNMDPESQKGKYENSFLSEDVFVSQKDCDTTHIAFEPEVNRPKLVSKNTEASVVLPPLFRTISQEVDNSKKGNLSDPKVKFANYSYHCEDPHWIAESFNSNLTTGLTDQEVEAKVKKYGQNVQSPPPKHLAKKIFMYFFGGFGALLLVSGILCCVCWKPLGNPDPQVANLALGVILFIVFLLQAGFNFVQDYSSSNVMKSINNLIPAECSVIRNGNLKIVEAPSIVPGDILVLTAGSKLPADVRIFECSSDLALDRAILTGEAVPLQATAKNDLKNSNYLESSRIGLQGTFIVSGSGKGIVISTGDETVFGSIAKLTSTPKTGLTPIQKEIFRFVAITGSIITFLIILIVILWAAWLRRSFPDWISVADLIIDLVSIAVAFIPEGLPIALTTCLVITANQMKKNKILCKSLATVETLGSISVLCFDKTGTITKNNMSVINFSTGTQEFDVDEDFMPNDDIATKHFLTISELCNDTKMTDDGDLTGNATDKAIFKFSKIFDSLKLNLQDKWFTIFELAFNSKDKYMAKLVEPVDKSSNEMFAELGYTNNVNAEKSSLLLVKGAPDIILKKCQYILSSEESKIKQLTPELKEKINQIKDKWSSQGKRVILIGSMVINNEDIDLNNSADTKEYIQEEFEYGRLCLVGLIGIQDPPRKNIDVVIQKLRQAGIRIAMITGDFELTGLEIARQVGIVTKHVDKYKDLIEFNQTGDSVKNEYDDFGDDEEEENKEFIMLDRKRRVRLINKALSLTGPEIDLLTDFEWANVVRYSELVCTRTTPEHKLLIIKQFQKYGAIIGMTGDGINDSPSLKQADVGISLIDASDIAKEASDLILMNDSNDSEEELFNSIIEALKYGRLVFENLRKTIAYLLPAGTFAELWPVLLNVIFGMPQMLSSFNMIIICCLTDCVGAIFLAYEPSESNLLNKKPRSVSGERLVDYKLFLHSYFTVGTYYTFTSFLVAFINLQRHGYKFSDFSLSYGTYETLPNVETFITMSSSIYFVNLVIMQFFNLMAMRTRYLSFFQLNLLKDNVYIYITIPFGLAVTFIINYVPAIQKALGTDQVPVEYYFIALGFGLLLFSYDEFRKGMIRRYPKCFFAKIAW